MVSGLVYNIWGLVDPSQAPSDFSVSPAGLNYKSGLSIRPHPTFVLVKGELQQVDYYAESDGNTFTDLLLRVNVEWVRDETTGRLLQRLERRRWTLLGSDDENPNFGPDEKSTVKFYTEKEAAIADARRRNNIVTDLTSQAEAFGVLAYVQTMFRSLDNELNAYEKTGDVKIIEKIGTYSGAWLNSPVPGAPDGVTLRMVIMDALTL